MRSAIKPFRALDNLRCDPWIHSHLPLPKAQGQMRERADREPGRYRTGAGVTNSVSYDCAVGMLLKPVGEVDARQACQQRVKMLRKAKNQVMIVILRLDPAAVRPRAEISANH